MKKFLFLATLISLPFAIGGCGGSGGNLSNGSISFDQLIASKKIGDMGKTLKFPIKIGELKIANIFYESKTRGWSSLVELKAEITNDTDQEIRGSLSVCDPGSAVVKVNSDSTSLDVPDRYYLVDCQNVSVKLNPNASYPRVPFGRAFFGNKAAQNFDICFDGVGCLIDIEPADSNLPGRE